MEPASPLSHYSSMDLEQQQEMEQHQQGDPHQQHPPQQQRNEDPRPPRLQSLTLQSIPVPLQGPLKGQGPIDPDCLPVPHEVLPQPERGGALPPGNMVTSLLGPSAPSGFPLLQQLQEDGTTLSVGLASLPIVPLPTLVGVPLPVAVESSTNTEGPPNSVSVTVLQLQHPQASPKDSVLQHPQQGPQGPQGSLVEDEEKTGHSGGLRQPRKGNPRHYNPHIGPTPAIFKQIEFKVWGLGFRGPGCVQPHHRSSGVTKEPKMLGAPGFLGTPYWRFFLGARLGLPLDGPSLKQSKRRPSSPVAARPLDSHQLVLLHLVQRRRRQLPVCVLVSAP